MGARVTRPIARFPRALLASLALASGGAAGARARAQAADQKPPPAEKAAEKKAAPAEPLNAPEPPPVSEAPKPLPARGNIELQYHGDRLYWKNIYAKDLK